MSLAGQTQAPLVQILTTFVRDLDTAISISSDPLMSLGEPNLISMGSSSCCWLFRLFATAWIDRIHSSLTQKKAHITAIESTSLALFYKHLNWQKFCLGVQVVPSGDIFL